MTKADTCMTSQVCDQGQYNSIVPDVTICTSLNRSIHQFDSRSTMHAPVRRWSKPEPPKQVIHCAMDNNVWSWLVVIISVDSHWYTVFPLYLSWLKAGDWYSCFVKLREAQVLYFLMTFISFQDAVHTHGYIPRGQARCTCIAKIQKRVLSGWILWTIGNIPRVDT